MTQPSSIDHLSDRASRLVDSLAEGMLSALENASERIGLAVEVGRIRTRMDAFGAVLESIDVQKQALLARQATASGPMQRLIARQIELLTAQETAVLQRIGVNPDVATAAVCRADRPARPKLVQAPQTNGHTKLAVVASSEAEGF